MFLFAELGEVISEGLDIGNQSSEILPLDHSSLVNAVRVNIRKFSNL